MSRFETEDEQLDQLKAWWNKNGTALLSVVLVGALSYSGWTYYYSSKYAASANASVTFEVLKSQYQNGSFSEVSREALKLMNEQPKSPYASSAAMLYAKFSFDKKEYDVALEKLQWVLTNSTDSEVKALANMRIAEVYLRQQKLEDAQSVLKSIDKVSVSSGMQAIVAFKQASLALTLNQLEQAKALFGEVVANENANANIKELAQLHLDDLS
jgi:predicted negative regulator of RcsB-dependent stress response